MKQIIISITILLVTINVFADSPDSIAPNFDLIDVHDFKIEVECINNEFCYYINRFGKRYGTAQKFDLETGRLIYTTRYINGIDIGPRVYFDKEGRLKWVLSNISKNKDYLGAATELDKPNSDETMQGYSVEYSASGNINQSGWIIFENGLENNKNIKVGKWIKYSNLNENKREIVNVQPDDTISRSQNYVLDIEQHNNWLTYYLCNNGKYNGTSQEFNLSIGSIERISYYIDGTNVGPRLYFYPDGRLIWIASNFSINTDFINDAYNHSYFKQDETKQAYSVFYDNSGNIKQSGWLIY